MGTAIFVIVIIVVLVIVIIASSSNNDLDSFRKNYASQIEKNFSSALGSNVKVNAHFQDDTFIIKFDVLGFSQGARQMLQEFYSGLNEQSKRVFKTKLEIKRIKFVVNDSKGQSEDFIYVN